jgi:hypothetical protein
MSEQARHNHYTLADIEAYLQGKLLPAEMHAMEKAALQDQFLADAIEGYRDADITETRQTLESIRAEISGTKETKSRVVPLRTWRGRRAVAALILLIGAATIGWLLFNQSNPHRQQLVQQTKPRPDSARRQLAQSRAIVNDSLRLTARNETQSKPGPATRKAKASSAAEKETALADYDYKMQEIDKRALLAANSNITSLGNLRSLKITGIASASPLSGAATSETMQRPDSTAIVATQPQYPAPRLNAETTASQAPIIAQRPLQGKVAGLDVAAGRKQTLGGINNLYRFTGTIVDNRNIAIPYATIVVDSMQTTTAADNKGEFAFMAPTATVNVQVNAIGFGSKTLKIEPNQPAHIVMDGDRPALEEVVVTGYGSPRKKVSTGAVVLQKSVADSLVPNGGWTAFNSYLVQKLTPGLSADTLTGFIEADLEFDLRGQVKTAIITKNLSNAGEKQIVSALKEGPRWENKAGPPAKGTKKKVTIRL